MPPSYMPPSYLANTPLAETMMDRPSYSYKYDYKSLPYKTIKTNYLLDNYSVIKVDGSDNPVRIILPDLESIFI